MSPASIFRLAWAQIVLALLAGLLLTFLPVEGWTEPLHHVGIGLLVAAVVTSFWHLREFSEFFERFSRSVLIENEFLSKLSFRSLADLRSKAARAILESCVDNPKYKHHELGEWIDRVLFEELLPGREVLSGIYRQGFKEDVSLEFITLRDALQEIGGDTSNLPDETLKEKVLRVISIAHFKVISPKLKSASYSSYKPVIAGRAAELPNFPLERRITMLVGRNEADAAPAKVVVKDEPKGGISFEVEPEQLLFEEGECEVWTKTVEYQSPERQSHILNTMGILTRDLEIDLRQMGAGPKLVFEGDIIATGRSAIKHNLVGGVELKYEGWLFEGHGYYLWWWEN